MIWMLLTAGIVLDHAHLVSPVGVAWSNSGFRRMMLERPEKFILFPVAIMAFGVAFGAEFQVRDQAFMCLIGVYSLWNSYHFGMQNYGLLALIGWRMAGFWALCVTMLAMSVLPIIAYGGMTITIIIMTAMSFTHWLTDISLSTFVSRYRWLFLGAVLIFGLVGFCVKRVHGGHTEMIAIPMILSLRICAGFVHFLYSRWVWRFSDPQVRATIGKELFA